ncbi:hypothetical protein PS410_01720 [Pediococcus acidilactici]
MKNSLQQEVYKFIHRQGYWIGILALWLLMALSAWLEGTTASSVAQSYD